MRKYAFFLVVLLLSGVSCSKISSDEALFKQKVSALLSVPFRYDFGSDSANKFNKASQEQREEELKAARDLMKFSRDFPGSRFADDARYLAIAYDEIRRKLGDNDEEIAAFEELIKEFPDGKIEISTVKYLEKALKPLGGPIDDIYLPYGAKLALLKGDRAIFRAKDYGAGLKYYQEFIGKIDPANVKLSRLLKHGYKMVSFCNQEIKPGG